MEVAQILKVSIKEWQKPTAEIFLQAKEQACDRIWKGKKTPWKEDTLSVLLRREKN